MCRFTAPKGKDEPQITADASSLTPSGTVTVATDQEGGIAYHTRYHFEYVFQEDLNGRVVKADLRRPRRLLNRALARATARSMRSGFTGLAGGSEVLVWFGGDE